MDDLERARNRMRRWRILRILYAGLPGPVGAGLVLEVLTDADLPSSPRDVANVLRYLEGHGYVQVGEVRPNGEVDSHLEAALTARGIDFVEYALPDEPGIARPAQ